MTAQVNVGVIRDVNGRFATASEVRLESEEDNLRFLDTYEAEVRVPGISECSRQNHLQARFVDPSEQTIRISIGDFEDGEPRLNVCPMTAKARNRWNHIPTELKWETHSTLKSLASMDYTSAEVTCVGDLRNFKLSAKSTDVQNERQISQGKADSSQGGEGVKTKD